MNGSRLPADFGRVAVLMGGPSAERAVSLRSGAAVLAALQRQGIAAEGVDVGPDIMSVLAAQRFDRAFIVLHGRFGEDGVIQGACEALGLPYTGTGVLGSALGMDKYRSKLVWQATGIPTPPFVRLRGPGDFAEAERALGFPMFVKPAREGSSIGVSRVASRDELPAAFDGAARCDSLVLAERGIQGFEVSCSILGARALPIVRIETPRAFYDYEAKYSANTTHYHCPSGLDAAVEERLQSLALRAFEALDCSGWGRVDFMVENSLTPWALEVNTVPGMTDHSLVPKAAGQAGMSFELLCAAILETTLERR